MIGAIAGDIAGSKIEEIEVLAFKDGRATSLKEREERLKPSFELFQMGSRFTDDTVLSIAGAEAILTNTDFAEKYKEYGRKYINAGYGSNFKKWILSDDLTPNNSIGNGAAMRVCSIGYAFDTIEEVLHYAKLSAEATHKHEEAVKGAQAAAAAVFLARKGFDKKYIKEFITDMFGYNLEQKLEEIRPDYKFDATCSGSVPQAITAFLESNDYEDSIRKALSIGGDSDTLACIAGGIAEAHYKKVPEWIVDKAMSYLDEDLKRVLFQFKNAYKIMW